MSIVELGSLGELIGAIAVVLSLLYVGHQVRQNTRAINAEMVQSQVEKTNSVNALVIEQPLLAAAMIKARHGEALDEQQELMMQNFFRMALRNFESFLTAERLNVLSEEDVGIHVAGIGRTFRRGYANRWWLENRAQFPTQLVARVDGLIEAGDEGFFKG